MEIGQRFRLTRYAMAIAMRDERHTAIIVPEGAIIEVMNGSFDGTRLMDVNYEGEVIMMFTDDMKPIRWRSGQRQHDAASFLTPIVGRGLV